MATPMYASAQQLLAFTQVLALEQGGNSRGGNNRIVQKLNGRTIRASFQDPSPSAYAAADARVGSAMLLN